MRRGSGLFLPVRRFHGQGRILHLLRDERVNVPPNVRGGNGVPDFSTATADDGAVGKRCRASVEWFLKNNVKYELVFGCTLWAAGQRRVFQHCRHVSCSDMGQGFILQPTIGFALATF